VLRQLRRTNGYETLSCAELALIMLVAEALHWVHTMEVYVVVRVDTV
jgi:hypothetical protein